MAKDAKTPRDLERSGALCLAFANTGAPVRDDRRRDSRRPPAMRLASYDELVTWSQRMGTLGAADGERLRRLATERPVEAATVVAGAAELRAATTGIFTALALGKEPRASDLEIVNRALRARSIVPAADGYRLDWGDDAEALERVLWPVAHSAAELLCSQRHRKVAQCAAKGCLRLFVHGNRRRLWCDANLCGSRARGRRYHRLRRQAKKQLGSTPLPELTKRLERLTELGGERLERRQKEAAGLRAGRPKQTGESGSGGADPS